jgi:hypothetical protein
VFDLINVYIKTDGRWVYEEGTRMHKTLADCERHYLTVYGLTVQCRFAWSDK